MHVPIALAEKDEALLNLSFTMAPNQKTSMSQLHEELKLMAKNEGGDGLHEGIVNWDQIAKNMHFLINENKQPSENDYMSHLVTSLKEQLDQIKSEVPEDKKTTETPETDDKVFLHDFLDEEHLYNALDLGNNLSHIKRLIQDSNTQIKLTFTNKKEELNYLYESQTKEL